MGFGGAPAGWRLSRGESVFRVNKAAASQTPGGTGRWGEAGRWDPGFSAGRPRGAGRAAAHAQWPGEVGEGAAGGLSRPGRVPLASAAMPASVEAGGSGCTSGEDTGVLRTAGEV